MEELSQPAVIT